MAASREEVFERVKEVLTEQLGVEESEINEEASFQEDLDADSLDLVELIMELEDQFGQVEGVGIEIFLEGRLPRPGRADHGAGGSVRDQDLGRGRPEDHDCRPGCRLRRLTPVAPTWPAASLVA